MKPPQSVATILPAVLLAIAGTLHAQERGPVGTVTLARTEYDRLLDLAGRPVETPETAPSPAALSRADVRVRVNGSTARATIALRGEVFHTGPVKVPLIAGATVLDARAGDRPLALLVENNTHTALITGPAVFDTILHWAAPVTYAPGRGSFVLPVPPAGSVQATIDVPGERSDVQVSHGLVLRRSSFDGRTVIDVSLDPGSETQVSWSARDAVAPATHAREVRLIGDVKTLITIGEADVRLLSVIDVTVIQGEPVSIEVRVPPGYDVADVSGANLDRFDEGPGTLELVVRNPAQRRHQFIVSLERAHSGGSFRLETALPGIPAAQRVSGEIAIEGIGSLEVSGADMPGLRRVDVREVDRTLLSVARQSLLTAYRYQRTTTPAPMLALDVTRFADAAVLAAVAERAVATTLVTSEGRTLTEITMTVRNRAQPWVKVDLPEGASIVSVEVAGEPARPVQGSDGTRVPLLRQGFRPSGPYVVSYVFMHAGTPFARRGDMQMTLPRMDLPVSIVEWELFVPERYRADRFEGNAIEAERYSMSAAGRGEGSGPGIGAGYGAGGRFGSSVRIALSGGSIGGFIVEDGGAPIPGVQVIASGDGQSRAAVSDATGRYVLAGIQSGTVTITAQIPGFKTVQQSVHFDQRPQQIDFAMPLGDLSETVMVQANIPAVRSGVQLDETQTPRGQSEPSANVQSLQRRAAGVLPVRIEVPRAGSSHRLVKPLVIDEETVVRFRYRTR